MATPYFQIRRHSVASTQDVARENFENLPLLVVASSQTGGRGRAGSGWDNADRALAVSLAIEVGGDDRRPFSLMAGVAAIRASQDTVLKWPNDVMRDTAKVGGILVERSDRLVIVGLGLNLWWKTPPQGWAGMFDNDPGERRYAEIGGLWGAELVDLIDRDGWPLDEYRNVCATLGRDIAWQPEGAGRAVDIADSGALVVESDGQRHEIHSAGVRHVR